MVCNPNVPAPAATAAHGATATAARGAHAAEATHGNGRDAAARRVMHLGGADGSGERTGPRLTASSPTAVQERQRVRQPYPNYRVIVLDDDVNTFQHVVEALVRHLPGMHPDRAWELAHRIDGEGSAVVWRGPQEQAELYHQLLGAEGLTMAPLERD